MSEDKYKIYTVFLSFQALDQEDAENFVYSLSGKDLLDHLEETGDIYIEEEE